MNVKMLTAAVLSAVALTTTACGTGAGSSKSTDPGKPTTPVSMSSGTLTLPGKGPVDATFLVDRTPLMDGDRSLAIAYKEAGLEFFAPTIARGGTGKVEVFGRVAGHAVRILTLKVASLKEAGPAARDDDAQRQAFAGALDIAVGLTQPPAPADQEALAKVTEGPGTDIARMAADAAEELSASTADATAVGIETDGWIDQPDFNLKRALTRSSPQAAGDKIAAGARLEGGAKPVTYMRIGALGLTAGRPDPGSPALERLDGAWRVGCKHLAETCETDTQP